MGSILGSSLGLILFEPFSDSFSSVGGLLFSAISKFRQGVSLLLRIILSVFSFPFSLSLPILKMRSTGFLTDFGAS
jgi:hypothetical protein